jgi:catechol 2,3-dioxygenase-like lactoylglutathione lyase family enzyme
MSQLEFPEDGMIMTSILVVKDISKSKEFYIDKLGAKLYNEYGGSSVVLNFIGSWLLLVTEGEPTPDKPNTKFSYPKNTSEVDHSFTIRVNNCENSYRVLKSKGVEFITPPYDWGHEKRCFFKDPDGHLFEISELVK